MNNKATAALRVFVLFPSLAIISACNSGSLGSDVGDQTSLPPVADAAIIGHDNLVAGGAVTAVVRSGSEVVLAGTNSYGTDGPLVDFDWNGTNAEAQALTLISRSSNIVSFKAPFVASTTTLNFTLTVTDADGETDTADVVVTVEPFPDSNHFLSYLVAPTKFQVVSATGDTLADDIDFDTSVRLRVAYPDRQGIQQVFEGGAEIKSGTWLQSIGSDPNDESHIGNPRLSFDIPSIDLDEINLPYANLPPGDSSRNRILDLNRSGQIDADVVIVLTPSSGDASLAKIFVPGAAPPASGSRESTFNGAAQELILPLEDLVAQPSNPQSQPYESSATAEIYYNTVDPLGERTTLSDWLVINCFDPDAIDLGADAHAVYTNNFDLGFGRDMYVKRGDECGNGSLASGDIASVVINYASILAAAKKTDPIIAVAMEYAPALPPFDAGRSPNDRFAKFYVFAPDEGTGEFVRLGSANFDGRGEKFVPGVCSVCHGGQPKPIQTAACDDGSQACYADAGDVGSIFMPWDVDSFLFTGPDGDPRQDSSLPPTTHPFLSETDLNALTTYTLDNQEDALRELNEAVLATYPNDAPVRELVHHWYHDPASDTEPDYLSNVLTGPFRSGAIPPGWQNVPNDPDNELYLGVIAQNCRACHTQFSQDDQVRPGFEDFQNFDASEATVSNIVFQQGRMPLARLTMDRFWVDYEGDSSSAGEILANYLGVPPDVGAPAAIIAVIEPFPVDCQAPVDVGRNVDVRFDGNGSSFVTSATWDLAYVNGPGSSATLVGATGLEPAFRTDNHGEWNATLTVTGPTGISDAATCVVRVANEAPVPPAVFVVATVDEGGTVNNINLRELIQAECGPDTCFGDEPATVAVDLASVNARGTIQIVDAATGTFNYTSTNAATDGPGTIGYTITDVDGDSDSGMVQINITSIAGPTAANRSATVAVNTTVQPVAFVFGIDALSLLNGSGGGVPPLNITAVTQGSNGGTVSIAGDGSNQVTYVPSRFETIPETFTYTITDDNDVAPKSDTATVTITLARQTTFAGASSSRVQTVFSNACAGCHGYGGFFAAEPDWRNYGVVTLNTLRVNIPDAPNDTGDAPGSQILTVPCTGDLPGGGAHPGGSGLLSGCPAATLSPTTQYGIVRRWIEEGAANN